MYKCKECEFITEKTSELANHYKHNHKEKKEYICEKCEKILKSKGGLTCHLKSCDGVSKIKILIKICPKCNYEIKNCNYEKHLNSCNGRGPRSKRPGYGKGILGWSKGLNKHNDERVRKISESLKGKPHKGSSHTDETKLQLSNIIKERYASGWESTAGRCKKIDYFSIVAGNVKVDGNWEHRVCIYLDEIGVEWIRNKKRFSYFNSIKNSNSTYCPDFYVKDWDFYIEVKGYKTELDEIKWKQFEYKLEIWDKKKLDSLGIDTKYKRKI
jgi:hypothetical protein